MNAGLLGAITALSWGGSDFIARFTGRGIGYANALLGMLLSGSVYLSIYVYANDIPFLWEWSSAWLIAGSGLSIMLATLMLFNAIARGPISVVSPIVASYPAFSMMFALLLGARPSAGDWLAVAAILGGVLCVARYGPTDNEPQHAHKAYRQKTIVLSLISALLFAIAILMGQLAAPIYGEVETTWLGRLFSLACLLILFGFSKSHTINLPVKWWPLLCAQGLLDSSAYISVFAAGHLPNGELAAVAASSFGAVTVLLARFILKEHITKIQWAAFVVIFGGVGYLAL